MFGILNVNKPEGFTSHDVVNKLRKILKIKQIGHTGTLDPMAIGVLPICIGKATKVIQYLDESKAYRAFIKLGIITDTYDMEGKIISDNPVKLDINNINQALSEFNGKITQIPPMYSAVHYKGKRLYEYARANIAVDDIPKREVTINSIKLVEVQDKESEHPILVVDIDCSGGTYIRSIAYDLGVKLEYGASLSGLIRTKSGKFVLDQSHTLVEIENLNKENKLSEILINPVCMLNLKCCRIDQNQLEKIRQGQYIKSFDQNNLVENERVQLVYENELAAIAEMREDKFFPVNVFI